MQKIVLKIWPEISWIKDDTLRNRVTDAWAWAIENSVLSADDLETIPFPC